MVGFLFAGALAGLGAIAWPLYLHLRRRNRRIQVIPSLRLFTLARQQRRRIRLQQFILMMSRVLVAAALFLLVAQPIWRTTRSIPLPLAPGEQDEVPTVGMLLDDGLTAQEADANGNRLELGREWLLKQIEALPPETQYRLVSSSCPMVTPLLGPDAAAAALKSYRSLPRNGDAALALRRLTESLAGELGCIVAAAPRSQALWDQLRPESDLPSKTGIGFLDTTDCRTPCYVAAVEPGDSDLTYNCMLAGQREKMSGMTLRVTQEDQLLRNIEVTPHDVLRGMVSIELPAVAPGTVFSVRLVTPYDHPWFTWHFQAGVYQEAEGAVVVMRPKSEAGVAADKLVTAILQAISPDLPIIHADASAAPPDLPERVAGIVCVGPLPSPAWRAWLSTRCETNVRVLCLPLAGQPAAPDQSRLPWYPAWGTVEPVQLAAVSPLQFSLPGTLPANGLEELVLAGITELPLNQLGSCPPLTGAEPVLATKDGRPVLQAVPAGSRSWALILNATLNMGANSPVFHPVFPLLLHRLLLPRGGRGADIDEALVGQAMPMPAWFARPALRGQLLAPGGAVIPIECSVDKPQYVPIDSPGVYEMQSSGPPSYRTANAPRPASDELFTREQWEQARPRTPTRWLGQGDRLQPTDFVRLAAEGGKPRIHTYDLSPLAVVVLLAGILVEVACLILAWRKGSS